MGEIGIFVRCMHADHSFSGWANNPNFPPFQKTGITPGIDPIIGQIGGGSDRVMAGTNPAHPGTDLGLPQFVDPVGGEYFFSPSITTLKEVLALPEYY